MCIIAVVPQGLQLDDDVVQRCWDHNNDGGGFAYVDNKNEIQVFKTMARYQFTKHYQEAASEFAKTSPMILHFRIKTHGKTNLENCHPFTTHKNLIFAHNGIISIPIPKEMDEMSDTNVFNEKILKELPPNFNDTWAYRALIHGYIGSSKLAFMDNERRLFIYNERLGDVSDDGVWFSNTTWRDWSANFYKYQKNDTSNWRQGRVWDTELKCYVDPPKEEKDSGKTTKTLSSTGHNDDLTESEWAEKQRLLDDKINTTETVKGFKTPGIEEFGVCEDCGEVERTPLAYIQPLDMLVCVNCAPTYTEAFIRKVIQEDEAIQDSEHSQLIAESIDVQAITELVGDTPPVTQAELEAIKEYNFTQEEIQEIMTDIGVLHTIEQQIEELTKETKEIKKQTLAQTQ